MVRRAPHDGEYPAGSILSLEADEASALVKDGAAELVLEGEATYERTVERVPERRKAKWL